MADVLTAEKLKQIAGDESEDMTAAQFAVDFVEENVKNYCHVDVFPVGLEHTGYVLALNAFRHMGIGASGESAYKATSINEGDVSVSYGDVTPAWFVSQLTEQMRAALNRYRKLVW